MSWTDGAAGGATAGGDEAPNVVAQNDVTKDLNFIPASDKAATQQAANVASGKSNSTGSWFDKAVGAIENPLSKALSALDIPRSAVVAGVGQILNTQEPNSAANLSGKSAWQQFMSDFDSHAALGHVMAEHGETPAEGSSQLGRWNNRVLGIVGDVALDPLNYVGGLGEVGKAISGTGEALAATTKANEALKAVDVAKAAGGDGIAEQATHDAAKATADKLNPNGVITPDTFGTLTTKGVAGLSDAEKEALGVKSGIGFGTAAHRATLVPGAVTDPLSGLLHEVGNGVRNKLAMSAFAAKVIPHAAVRQALGEAAKAGDWTQAQHLGQVLRTSVVPGASRQAFLNKHGPVLKAALKPFAPEDMDHLRDALEGVHTPEADALNPDHVGAVRTSLDDMVADAKAHGVNMGTLDDYFPHQLSDEASLAAAKAGKTGGSQEFAGAMARKYKAGDQFLGHTLENGSVSEMNGIANLEHGQDAYPLFKTDTAGALSSYMHGMASRVGQQDWASELDKLGVTSAGDAVKSHEDWGKLASAGAFADTSAPSYVKEAMQKLKEEQLATAAHKPGKVMGHFDKMMNVWRNYELAMPGKAIRHAVATPAWGHFIGGVGIPQLKHSMGVWRAFQHGGEDAVKDESDKAHLAEFLQSGSSHGHAFEDLHGKKGPNAKPYSSDFAYFRANREVQARAQDYSKFAMFQDARNKGMDKFDAAKKVRGMLGDPHGLTDAERSFRRLVPFYAFLRTQMPTQLKAIAHTPGKFVDFVNAEHDAETGTPTDTGAEPSFYKQTMSFRLPWKSGGNSTYLSPDLPFTRMNQLLSGTNQLVAQTNPLLQIPLEHAFGNTNASTGAPFSTTAQPIPGVLKSLDLGPVLAAVNLAQKQTQNQTDYGVTTKAGTYMMMPQIQQAIDSLIPPEAQARRLDTSDEPTMASRKGTTELSYGLGQNFRTNDPYQQASELYRRDAIIKKIVEGLQNNGTLPKYIKGFEK